MGDCPRCPSSNNADSPQRRVGALTSMRRRSAVAPATAQYTIYALHGMAAGRPIAHCTSGTESQAPIARAPTMLSPYSEGRPGAGALGFQYRSPR